MQSPFVKRTRFQNAAPFIPRNFNNAPQAFGRRTFRYPPHTRSAKPVRKYSVSTTPSRPGADPVLYARPTGGNIVLTVRNGPVLTTRAFTGVPSRAIAQFVKGVTPANLAISGSQAQADKAQAIVESSVSVYSDV